MSEKRIQALRRRRFPAVSDQRRKTSPPQAQHSLQAIGPYLLSSEDQPLSGVRRPHCTHDPRTEDWSRHMQSQTYIHLIPEARWCP